MAVRGPLAVLLTVGLVLTGLIATRPSPAVADAGAAAFQQRLRDVRSSHPDALVVTGRGDVQRRGGDDVPALLQAVADPRDARTFARGLELLLAAQGQAIGIAHPVTAPDGTAADGGRSTAPSFQQTPAPPPPPMPQPGVTESVEDSGGSIGWGFLGQSVVIDDVSGDGLDDVVQWSHDGEGASAIEVVRGIDGTSIWRAELSGSPHYGVSLQPVPDTNGDGVADLLTSIHQFDEESSESTCDDRGCVGSERFTWLVQLRDGTSGAVVWERRHEGSNEYEDSFGGVEYRSRYATVNGFVPYQPLQDVTGDGIGDFLVTLTREASEHERTVEGRYPGPVTEVQRSSGTATTTLQVLSGADAAVVEELTEGPTDSVLGGRALPDTTGDGVNDVLLVRRDLSSSERTCTTEGTSRTCTEEGQIGGIEVELRTAPELEQRWQADFPVQEGFASSPGDLTGDDVRDVVVQAYSPIGEGILVVLDGGDGEEVWTDVDVSDGRYGGESLLATTPLEEDGALDLLAVRHREGAPGQAQLEIVRRDGATGEVLLVTGHGIPTEGEGEHYVYSYASGAADADQDGAADVVIITERLEEDDQFSLTTIVESGRTGAVLATLPQQPGQYNAYQLVGDLDGDGGADAVATGGYYGGPDGEEVPPSTTAVRLRDGSVLWERPGTSDSHTYGMVTAQLDGDAGEDLLTTQERYTEVIHLRQTVAIDGEDGQTLWVAPTPPEVRRVAGGDRIATAVALSQATSPAAETVVLARADDFPDALAGGPLAAALDAPLLLTGSAGLDPATAAEVQRLGAATAVLLGGESALSAQVATDLAAAGLTVERLSGEDRYATAAAIADRVAAALGPLERVAIAAGGQDAPAGADGEPTGWTDAILASAYGAATDAPLLLVRADGLPTATVEALQRLAPSESTMLVGDAAAINPEPEQQIRDLTGNPTERLARPTPAETAELVARFAIRDGASSRWVWVATSTRFPDALAASAAVGATGGVLLLTDGSPGADATMADFLSRYGPVAEAVTLVGGPTAISGGTEAVAADAVSLE